MFVNSDGIFTKQQLISVSGPSQVSFSAAEILLPVSVRSMADLPQEIRSTNVRRNAEMFVAADMDG